MMGGRSAPGEWRQSQTINPGPLVGTESRPIPGMQDLRTPNYFTGESQLAGHVRENDEGRYSGTVYRGGKTTMFNVRTQGRAQVAAEALSRASNPEQRGAGLMGMAERRFETKRARR